MFKCLFLFWIKHDYSGETLNYYLLLVKLPQQLFKAYNYNVFNNLIFSIIGHISFLFGAVQSCLYTIFNCNDNINSLID